MAHDIDAPAMLCHDLLDDREADPRTGFAGFFSPPGAVELLKDFTHFLLIHSDSLILHRNLDALAIAAAINGDLGARRRVLHRVRQEIVKSIFHQLAIAADGIAGSGGGDDWNLLAVGQGTHSLDAFD